VEYPGYAGRGGERSEASFVADGARVARLAAERFGDPLYVLGESLGCAVATAVAAVPGLRIRGAVLITPWADLPRLAQSAYWFLPARWLVRDRYDNVSNLLGYGGPVAVAVSEHDEVVPPRHSHRLYDAIASPKLLWVFEGAGHNTWSTSPDDGWWDAVLEFLERTAPRSGG
jgi:hypothetical protein